MNTSDSNSGGGNPRANFFVPNCKSLRASAGKTKSDLSRKAKVDRNTINRIEKLIGVTEEKTNSVFNVLNKWHPSKKLDAKIEITNKPEKIKITGRIL